MGKDRWSEFVHPEKGYVNSQKVFWEGSLNKPAKRALTIMKVYQSLILEVLLPEKPRK